MLRVVGIKIVPRICFERIVTLLVPGTPDWADISIVLCPKKRRSKRNYLQNVRYCDRIYVFVSEVYVFFFFYVQFQKIIEKNFPAKQVFCVVFEFVYEARSVISSFWSLEICALSSRNALASQFALRNRFA